MTNLMVIRNLAAKMISILSEVMFYFLRKIQNTKTLNERITINNGGCLHDTIPAVQ